MEYELNNLLPDTYDERDYLYLNSASSGILPKEVDHRKYAREIENQYNTGSCVANATVSCLELLGEKVNKQYNLSRLFLYYNLREPYVNLKDKDIGSYTRDGFKKCNKFGIPSESMWPFDLSKINIKPNDEVYSEAIKTKVNEYRRIPGFSSMFESSDGAIDLFKLALAEGYPVLFGMKLGRTFYDLGKIKDLKLHDYGGLNNDSIGGHAMCAVGYSDELEGFIVENSWGKNWGDNGFCLIKYEVMKKDCHDVWVCTKFDDIQIIPEFVAPVNPELVANGNVKDFQYLKDDVGAIKDYEFEMEVYVSGGLPPYNYMWYNLSGFGNKDNYITELDKDKAIYKLNKGNRYTHVCTCRVTDSGLPQQSINVNFGIRGIIKPEEPYIPPTPEPTIEPEEPVKPEPTIEPTIEPEEPVKPEPTIEPEEPVKPKEKDDDDYKKWGVIGGVISIFISAFYKIFKNK